jgi:signal transduction histidine kinase
VHNKRYVYALAFVYSTAILILISIPSGFYLQVEKENNRQAARQQLKQYAYGIEKQIYDFSRSQKQVFDFPRSVLYGSHLYDANGQLIFATDHCQRGINDFDMPGLIYKRIALDANRFGAHDLIVAQPLNNRAVYIKALGGMLFLGAAVFAMNLLFIRVSLKPLERLNRHLNTFFNDAMHELKTPLGVMQLNLEWLKDQEETKPIRRLINSIHNITLIYEDIEYHLKQDHVAYRPEWVDFARLLSDRIEVFRDLAATKGIGIDEKINPGTSVWINRIELQRIIDNTLSNAIKYSDRATTVRVRLVEGATKIRLDVIDEGEGIRDTQNVFERYYRENTVQGGFGLGLSIVKFICDKNNIRIELKSQSGQGSTFAYLFEKSKHHEIS